MLHSWSLIVLWSESSQVISCVSPLCPFKHNEMTLCSHDKVRHALIRTVYWSKNSNFICHKRASIIQRIIKNRFQKFTCVYGLLKTIILSSVWNNITYFSDNLLSTDVHHIMFVSSSSIHPNEEKHFKRYQKCEMFKHWHWMRDTPTILSKFDVNFQ